MDCSEAGRLGAEKRRQLEQEYVLARARLMRDELGLPPDPRLYPPLILTRKDRA